MEVRKIDARSFEVIEEQTKKHNMDSLLRDLAAMQTRIDEFQAKKNKIQELIDAAKTQLDMEDIIIPEIEEEELTIPKL